MAVAASVFPEGSGEAVCVDAGHEHGSSEGVEFDYTWYRATATPSSMLWKFDHWEWKHHFDHKNTDPPEESSIVKDRSSSSNPLERKDAYDFGEYTMRGGSYGTDDHSWVSDLVAVFTRNHHIGTGMPVYNADGTIRCKGSSVAFDNSF